MENEKIIDVEEVTEVEETEELKDTTEKKESKIKKILGKVAKVGGKVVIGGMVAGATGFALAKALAGHKDSSDGYSELPGTCEEVTPVAETISDSE